MLSLAFALVGVVGDVIPAFARAYRHANTPKRQTLPGEVAVSVTTIFSCLANEENSVEPSVFPIQCKKFGEIPSVPPHA